MFSMETTEMPGTGPAPCEFTCNICRVWMKMIKRPCKKGGWGVAAGVNKAVNLNSS